MRQIPMCAHSRRLVLSPPARADLRDILAVTTRRHGYRQRDTYAATIASALAQLASFPGMGREMPEFRPGARRFPIREHVVYYESDAQELRVSRILHSRMDASVAFSDEGTP